MDRTGRLGRRLPSAFGTRRGGRSCGGRGCPWGGSSVPKVETVSSHWCRNVDSCARTNLRRAYSMERHNKLASRRRPWEPPTLKAIGTISQLVLSGGGKV